MSERRMPEKDDLPSNSFSKPKVQETSEKRKPKQVVTNPQRRQRGVVENELHEVKDFVVSDVIRPTLQDMVFNIISGIFGILSDTAEAMIFGEAKPHWNSYPTRSSTRRHGRTHIPYNSIRDGNRSIRKTRLDYDDEPLEDYRDVEMSRADAEEVKEEMYNIFEDQGYLTVGDLNYILGVRGNYTDEDWGWTSLAGVRIKTARRGRGRYIIDMPRPKAL